ncbi:VirK/YbjX family protein [Oxalobacteraceae bacterium A2-2]
MSQSITIRSGLAGYGGFTRLRERIKLSLRARLHAPVTGDWLRLLNSHPLFGDLVQARPRLVYKVYRPYLSTTLGHRQRLAVLHDHYRFVFRHGLGPTVVQAARGGVLLAEIDGKSGLPYQVRLQAIEPMEREGELVLQLTQGATVVYSCAFSFFHGERGMVVGVGCMQGPRGSDGLQLIKDATRELHGMRPKNLMVRLLRQLGHDYGCAELRLVGNDNRAVRSATRQGKVHADYDALWQELEAVRRADGDWLLPCEAIASPDMAAIPSKKRSEARKRHETLESCVAQLRASLRAPRFAAVPTLLAQDYATVAANQDQDELLPALA